MYHIYLLYSSFFIYHYGYLSSLYFCILYANFPSIFNLMHFVTHFCSMYIHVYCNKQVFRRRALRKVDRPKLVSQGIFIAFVFSLPGKYHPHYIYIDICVSIKSQLLYVCLWCTKLLPNENCRWFRFKYAKLAHWRENSCAGQYLALAIVIAFSLCTQHASHATNIRVFVWPWKESRKSFTILATLYSCGNCMAWNRTSYFMWVFRLPS